MRIQIQQAKARGCTFLCVLITCGGGVGCDHSDSETAIPSSPASAAKQLDRTFSKATSELQRTVNTAAEAMRAGDFEKAVVSLQVVKAAEGLTLDQGVAVHGSMVALEQRLMTAAAAGDAKAQKAYDLLKAIKRN